MLSKAPSLLEQLEQHLNVDCDNLDPAFIQTLPIRPHDQTSNQRIVHEAFVAPENKDIMEKTVKEMKGSSWDDIYVVCVSRIRIHIAQKALCDLVDARPPACPNRGDCCPSHLG
jgi:transaldolase